MTQTRLCISIPKRKIKILDSVDKLKAGEGRSEFGVKALEFYIEYLTNAPNSLRAALPDIKTVRLYLMDNSTKEADIQTFKETVERLLNITTKCLDFKKSMVNLENDK